MCVLQGNGLIESSVRKHAREVSDTSDVPDQGGPETEVGAVVEHVLQCGVRQKHGLSRGGSCKQVGIVGEQIG